MQDPFNVREEIKPRLEDAMRIVGRQLNVLDDLRPHLQACAQPSPAQLASHRAHEQGDARLLRGILAVLTDSIPQLDVAADLFTAALKHTLDSGATRDALPFLGHNQTQDQIAEYLLTRPRTAHAVFDLQRFHVSIHITLFLLRLTIDHYLDRCVYTLRRLGLPRPQGEPLNHAMAEARTHLQRAYTLVHAAFGHNIDAIYGPSDR